MANMPFTTDSMMLAGATMLAALAVYTDLRWRIIPNRLTLPAIALGLALGFLGSGWHGLLMSGLGFLTGMALLILPFAVGKMGGGDVKLMGALGAWLGCYAVLNVALYSALAGGVLAILVAVKRKRLGVTIRNVWLLLKCIFLFRSPETGCVLFERSIAIPYGLAIGGGVLCLAALGKIV